MVGARKPAEPKRSCISLRYAVPSMLSRSSNGSSPRPLASTELHQSADMSCIKPSAPRNLIARRLQFQFRSQHGSSIPARKASGCFVDEVGKPGDGWRTRCGFLRVSGGRAPKGRPPVVYTRIRCDGYWAKIKQMNSATFTMTCAGSERAEPCNQVRRRRIWLFCYEPGERFLIVGHRR